MKLYILCKIRVVKWRNFLRLFPYNHNEWDNQTKEMNDNGKPA